MIRAQIITHRVGAGVALKSLLSAGDAISDISQHPAPDMPSPDSVVWELVGNEATLAAVEADDDHYVLWSEVLDYGE